MAESHNIAKTTDFHPDKHNANKGTEKGAIVLDDSVTQLGLGRSIVVDKHGNIIAGNKTQQTAVDNGIEDAIVIESDGKKLVVVKRTDLDLYSETDDRARLLGIMDNRSSELNLEWDKDNLDLLMHNIQSDSISVQAALSELANENDLYFGEEPELMDPEPQVDRAEELQEKWQVKRGDLWQIGGHKLLCGDSTNEGDVKRLVGDGRIQISILDPVYGDEILEALRISKRISNSMLAIAWGFEIARYVEMLGAYDFDYVCETGQGLMFAHKPIQRHKIMAYWDNGEGVYNYDVHKSKEFSTSICFWHLRAKRSEVEMKYSKPVEQFAFFIELHSIVGDVIYDPFLGSGTTIVACERLMRIGLGIEINPNYCAIILERLYDMGLTPELIE